MRMPPKKVKGRGGWCAKCGHFEDSSGNKRFVLVWPREKHIKYRGRWLCLEHYAQELRSDYKREWMQRENVDYMLQDNIPWEAEGEGGGEAE